MNDKDVCRAAPATPGLLMIVKIIKLTVIIALIINKTHFYSAIFTSFKYKAIKELDSQDKYLLSIKV